MFKERCREVLQKFNQVYVYKILGTSSEYCFYFADEYGNKSSVKPYCVNKDTGFEVTSSGIELYGVELEIPEEFASCRERVIKRLEKEFTDFDIRESVNSLYAVEKFHMSEDEIYRICYVFCNIISNKCTGIEKQDIRMIRNNPYVRDFLISSLDCKISEAANVCSY